VYIYVCCVRVNIDSATSDRSSRRAARLNAVLPSSVDLITVTVLGMFPELPSINC